MEVHEGYGISKGAALASIAKVRFDFGIASLTPQRMRALGERLVQQEQAGFIETEEIILVAETLPITMLTGSLPGIQVVGVALAGYVDEPLLSQLDEICAGVPVVAGLGDPFVREISEHEIALVDGDNGRVYLAPDADIVARFQSSASRKRYFIEGVHVTARTASDNRTIPVLASARTDDDIDIAMSAGADGLYLPQDNQTVGGEHITSGEKQLAALHAH